MSTDEYRVKRERYREWVTGDQWTPEQQRRFRERADKGVPMVEGEPYCSIHMCHADNCLDYHKNFHFPLAAESDDEYKKRLNELLRKMQAEPIGGYMSDVVKLGDTVLWSKWQSSEGEQLCPAIVTAVHEDGTVNLTIFPDGEGMQTRTQVRQGNGVGDWRLR